MGIQIKNVFYTYNKKASNSTLALNDISFAIEDNDFVAIVGETGSGKSTLAQTLNGLIFPDKGEVQVNDFLINYKNRKSKSLKGLRKHVGLVFQFPEYQLFEETVEKDVAFGIKNFGVKADDAIKLAHEALKQVGLDESYYKRAPFDLSGGERRKVAIAGIIALNPDVLILDEPTVGFDPNSAKELMKLVCEFHQKGKTIIVITHDMDLVYQYTNKVFLLDNGKLSFSGTPTELCEFVQNYDRLDIPQIIKLAISLRKKGLDIDTYSIHDMDDLIKQIKEWRAHKNG